MISWKNPDTWTTNGYTSEQGMFQFKINMPGDPCNFSGGKFALTSYLGGGRVCTKHATLKAAKDKAYKLYRKEYPLPEAEYRSGGFGPNSFTVWLPVKHNYHAYYTNTGHDGLFIIVDNTLNKHATGYSTYANLGEVKRAIRRMYNTFVKNGGLK